jgi:hypothetical protein
LHRRDRAQASMRFVMGNQGGDIHIRYAIAIGKAEGAIV